MIKDTPLPKDLSQEEERFWTDIDKQYFSPPHNSVVLSLKNHIWHTNHIAAKLGSYLANRKAVTNKQTKKRLNLRSVKFPVRLTRDATASGNSAAEGLYKYLNTTGNVTPDPFQGLLDGDNFYRPLATPKYEPSQRLPTVYSQPLPDAMHMSFYVPSQNPKAKHDGAAAALPDPKAELLVEGGNVADAVNSFVADYKPQKSMNTPDVPTVVAGPTPCWFTHAKGRFKRGFDPTYRCKKAETLIRNPNGLISDPVWQHLNMNYVDVATRGAARMPYNNRPVNMFRKADEQRTDKDVRAGNDLLNYHTMSDLATCRVDYSPLLFSFVVAKKTPVCRRCLGMPKVTCNICNNADSKITGMFSQMALDEKFHFVFNAMDLFKLRRTSNELTHNYYLNPFANEEDRSRPAAGREPAGDAEENHIHVVYNYAQTLKNLNAVYNNLLDRIRNEYKPDKRNWHKTESKMLDTYIEEYNNKTLDNRYTYTVQKQSVDVLTLRLHVKKSADLPSNWTDRALCSICGTDEDWDDDPILFCDCCFIPMHFCCLGHKAGTLMDVKRKINMAKLQRQNYLTGLTTNGEKPKKLGPDKLEDLLEMDDEEWYCPACTYLMDQLFFLDENLVMSIIRRVAGPKNREQYTLMNQGAMAGNFRLKHEDERTPVKLEHPEDEKLDLPAVLGFDYDNPLDRKYIRSHSTPAHGLRGLGRQSMTPRDFAGDDEERPEGKRLEDLSVLNVYNGERDEVVSYNANNVGDPKTFCKALLSKGGLFFENTFWMLASRSNLAAIQEYLNYFTLEELYLSRLVQQDKLIHSTKQLAKKRSNSLGSAATNRSLSISSKDSVTGKRKDHAKEENGPPTKLQKTADVKSEPDETVKGEEAALKHEGADEHTDKPYSHNANMNCKNPLKKLYVSVDVRTLSCSAIKLNTSGTHKGGAKTLPNPRAPAARSAHASPGTHHARERTPARDAAQHELGPTEAIDVVVKVPVCIFCGFDAYFPGGGPMKKTSNTGTWGHIKCALANDCVIEPEEINYNTFVPKVKALKCIICLNWSTSVVQCSYGNCCKAFHVPCCSYSPACLFTWDSNGKPDVLCPVHSQGLAPTSLLRKLQMRLGTKGKFGKPEARTNSKEGKDAKDATQAARDLKPIRSDGFDNVCINENLYLRHFLRPNYNNLAVLLELLLNEDVGALFQANMASNYYAREANALSRLNSATSAATNGSGSAGSARDPEDTTSSAEPVGTDSLVGADAHDYARAFELELDANGQPRTLYRSASWELEDSARSARSKRGKPGRTKSPRDKALSRTTSLSSATDDELLDRRCPMNNVSRNNCFWCCLGFDAAGHNKHLFDDRTPSSKAILNMLFQNNQKSIQRIKAQINDGAAAEPEADAEESEPEASSAESPRADGSPDSPPKQPAKRTLSAGANVQADKGANGWVVDGDPEGYRRHRESQAEKMKMPWSILSNIMMTNGVDEKVNAYVSNDVINSTRLMRKNELAVQKYAADALVRLLNTFEPDSTKPVVATMFAIMRHINFMAYTDIVYGHNAASTGGAKPRIAASRSNSDSDGLKSDGKRSGAESQTDSETNTPVREVEPAPQYAPHREYLKKQIFKLLKDANEVEILKVSTKLLPNSILRKHIVGNEIAICKVCLEFKYMKSSANNTNTKRNMLNESYRRCIDCHAHACNFCLSATKHDFDNLTRNPGLVLGGYVGDEVDSFHFRCVRCRDLRESPDFPLLSCALCSRFDGLMLRINMKHTSFMPTSCYNATSYAHQICLEWLFWSKNVNATSKRTSKMQFEHNCNYCGVLTGATVTCSNTTCVSKFHASCAGFLGCKIDVGKKNEGSMAIKRAMCLRHTLVSMLRTSMTERKFMVAPSYLYESLINDSYFARFFRGAYLSNCCISNKTKVGNRTRIKKRARAIDYRNSLSVMKMASYINYGLIINKQPQVYELTLAEPIARDRLIQGMSYIFYQQNPFNAAAFGTSGEAYRGHPGEKDKKKDSKEIRSIITLIRNGMLKPIQGSKRGRKPKSLDGSDVDKRHRMSMEDILRHGHTGVLETGEFYCPVCFSIYFENAPGTPGDDLHWIGCDKCERWFHFVCAGVWVDYRDKDLWYCYHCSTH